MKFNIAIIKPNNFITDSIYTKKLKNDDGKNILLENIKNHIDLKEVSNAVYDIDDTLNINMNELMMNVIIDNIKLSKTQLGSTTFCHEDANYVYELCHIKQDNNDDKQDRPINGISSYLAIDKKEIYGSVALIKSKILENNTCIHATVSIDDICNILYQKIVHMGLKISASGDISEYKFVEDPMENENIDINEYRCIEIAVLGFNFLVVIDTKSTKINKKITILFGKHIVCGDVYIACKITEHCYSSIDTTTFNKLIDVLHGPLSSRELKSHENIDRSRKNDQLPKIMNNFCILQNRYKDLISNGFLCENCGKKETCLTCTKCYRIKYCSNKCQSNDKWIHERECIQNTVSYNNKFK